MNECTFDGKNHCCSHTNLCIFDENRIKLESNIYMLKNKLEKMELIRTELISGNIIYHDELDQYYDIKIIPYIGYDKETHFKLDVRVDDNIINAIDKRIFDIEYDIDNLKKYLKGHSF